MTRENASQTQSQREFYKIATPEAVNKYFKDGSYKIAVSHARKDLIPQFDIVTPQDVANLDATARLLASVEDTNPDFKNIDPNTDQGKFDLADETQARGIAAVEQTTDPKVKAKILKTVDWAVDGIFDTVGKTAAKIGGKKGVLVLSGLAFGTAACSPNVIAPPVIPDGGGTGGPTATEVTPTATPEVSTTEVFNFKVAKEAKDFRSSVITEDQAFTTYFDWLKTLPVTFDESKLKPFKFLEMNIPGWGRVIFPDVHDKSIDFNDPSQLAWQFPTYNEMFVTGPDGVDYPYIVEPIIFHKDGQNYPVITARTYYTPSWGPKNNYSINAINHLIDTIEIPLIEKMPERIIIESTITPGGTLDDPIPLRTLKNFPDIQERFKRFADGDVSALSQKGIIVLTRTAAKQETLFYP